MTRLLLEVKNEREAAILRAILKFLNISIISEERQEGDNNSDLENFYNQFALDLSNFQFDREAAHER